MKIIKIEMPLPRSHGILSPRIGYIVTTVDGKGRVNAASFSNITSVSTEPERLVLSVYKKWDTLKNIKKTKEFVVNVPSRKLLNEVWICGDKYAGNPIPYGINELEIAGLTPLPAKKVKPPLIAECHGNLECKVVWMKNVGDHTLILANIVRAVYTNGAFDNNLIQNIQKTQPLLEIGRGNFTYPVRTIKVNRNKVRKRVENKLRKMKVRVPEKLKKYGKFSKE